jgi:hypothetical protein
MAERQWYTAIGDKQEGPFSDAQLRGMITASTVRADTLVWCDGMSNWTHAGNIPGLMGGAHAPPRLPVMGAASPTAAVVHTSAIGPLATTIPTWSYFGRALLVIIGQMFIIPAPWVMTSFYRWFVDRIELPGGQRVAFTGKPGDIWYIFILNALCSYLGLIGHYISLLTLPLTVLFIVIITRWVCRNLAWEGQADPLTFTGGYWPMLGWYVLLILSMISIVGWAWVTAAWTRWLCRRVEGSARKLVFNGSGWGILWRTFLFVLSCIPLIPIPWTLHWYTRWFVSQLGLAHEGGPSITA